MRKKWRKEEEEYKSKSRERHASKHQQQDKIQLDMNISLFDSDESFGNETPVTSTSTACIWATVCPWYITEEDSTSRSQLHVIYKCVKL